MKIIILGTIKFVLFFVAVVTVLYGAAKIYLAMGDSFISAVVVAAFVMLAIGVTFAVIFFRGK